MSYPEPVAAAERATFVAHLRAVAERRDTTAFAALFRFYAPRVKGYLLRLGCSMAQAEDLTQEVMTAVWRKAALYDPAKAEPSTWIFTIARNLRIDAVRRERRPDVEAHVTPQDPIDETPRLDDKIAFDQRADLVRRALAELPPDQADVVRRSFFEDKSHAEIAAEIGVPLGTVKSRLRLALRKVRVILGEKEAP